MSNQLKQVSREVKVNNKVVGYVARAAYIGVQDQNEFSWWVIANDLKDPKWRGVFKSRREAREELEKIAV